MFLGHTGYYQKFIRRYSDVAAPIETLLNNERKFQWTMECQEAMDTLKDKLVNAPILKHPNWDIIFHVHTDASGIAIGAILAQPGSKKVDHLVYYASRKMSIPEKNYTTTEQEALAMVFSLQKFRHFLLPKKFKFFTDHQALKYLVNKPIHQGKIIRWILLFQEYEFDIVVKPSRHNVGPDHLSRIDTGEEPVEGEDELPDAELFRVQAVPESLNDIAYFLSKGEAPTTMSVKERQMLALKAS